MYSVKEKWHGKAIKAEDMKSLPVYEEFLDKELNKVVKNKINREKSLLFLPTAFCDDKTMQDEQYSKSTYKLIAFGILEDGRSVSVIINNIFPYFEIKIPDDHENKEEYAQEIFTQLKMKNSDIEKFIDVVKKPVKFADYWAIDPLRYEIVEGKPLRLFQEHLSSYVRIYFNKPNHRKDAINYIRALNIETAHDDLTCYHLVVFRDILLQPSNWWTLNNYKYDDDHHIVKGDVFKIDVEDISNYIGPRQIHHKKDYTMTLTWDIETYRPDNDGEIPKPENPNDKLFMIGSTIQWYHAEEPLLSVCFVDVDAAPHPDCLTIICGSEKKIIEAFAEFYSMYRPKIVMGFNDGDYDWPWLFARAQTYEIDNLLLDKFSAIHDNAKPASKFEKREIKIEATTSSSIHNLQAYGYIPIDVMVAFRQIYPTSEQWSLNYFLKNNKLDLKEDMPYLEMFRIYENATHQDATALERMALVSKYCVIDALSCHRLTRKRNLLMDRREVSNISYTTLKDAFYRADGVKVRNLVLANANLRGLHVSNITNDVMNRGKYPGAWVCPPTKGLCVSKLSFEERIKKAELTGENLEEWKSVDKEQVFEVIREYGAVVPEDKVRNFPKCVQEFLTEDIGRPITGLDFSSLYPSLIMAYNLSPEYMILDPKFARAMLKTKKYNLHKVKFQYNGEIILGWSVRHDNKLDPNSDDFRFGLFPSILKELFDRRKQLKSNVDGLGYWEHKKEELLRLPNDVFNTPEIQAEYDDACFNYSAIDSKQKALKVFMNCFYGEAGNQRSPLFMLQIAGGITSAGRDNIIKAYDFIKSRGCKVYYGDSVTKNTPVLIRYTTGNLSGFINICSIENIPGSDWEECSGFKIHDTISIRNEKQSMLPVEGLETWTSSGWAPIKRVIRHKTNKCIFRINTEMGCVDVTEDHSLLGLNKEKLKPTEVKIGDNLYHGFPTEFYSETILANYKYDDENYLKDLTEDEAFIWGVFLLNGKCLIYHTNDLTASHWRIETKDAKNFVRVSKLIDKVEPGTRFYYITPDSPGLHLMMATEGIEEIAIKYRKLFYEKDKLYAQIPSCIFNAPIHVRKAFLNGVCSDLDDFEKFTLYIRHDDDAIIQGIYYLMRSVGHDNISISVLGSNCDVFCLEKLPNRQTGTCIKAIMSIRNTSYRAKSEEIEDFVYDIETADGTFLAGIGETVLSNTDSCYSCAPSECFRDVDIKFYTEQITKLEYWEELIKLTFDYIKILNKEINEMLENDNGTKFLKMAYEEVLYPVLFTAKKKYVGRPHISVPNFDPKVPLFIRGLDMKKRGVPPILTEVCDDLLKNAMSLENLFTIIELVQQKIKEIYNRTWSKDEFDDFVKTSVYKPKKNNVAVHTFYRRMIEEYNITITPGERFKYVMVKKPPFTYDIRGRKQNLKAGDIMEFPDVAIEKGMEIDLNYYMTKNINGQFARFITYYKDFYVQPEGQDSDSLKKAEDEILKLARKYVDEYCEQFYTKFQDYGPIYKTIYKKSAEILKREFAMTYSDNKIFDVLWQDADYAEDVNNFEEWIIKKAETYVEKKRDNKNYGEVYVNYLLKKNDKEHYLDTLIKSYYANRKSNILSIVEKLYKERQGILQNSMRQSLSKIKAIYKTNDTIISSISKKIKEITNFETGEVPQLEIDIESEITPALQDIQENIAEFRFIYVSLISNYEYVYQTRSIVEYLKRLRNSQVGNICNKNIKIDIKTMVEETIVKVIEDNIAF